MRRAGAFISCGCGRDFVATYAATVAGSKNGLSPLICVRCISRRDSGSNASRRCIYKLWLRPRLCRALRRNRCRIEKRLVAFNLRAMHQPPRLRVECVAPVHSATVVPDDQVADFPFLVPREALLRSMRPKFIEQVLAFGQRQADDVSVAPAAEVQRVAAGHGMGADQRVYRARRLARVGDVLEAFAQLARAVAA